jgi:hypothetical protein
MTVSVLYKHCISHLWKRFARAPYFVGRAIQKIFGYLSLLYIASILIMIGTHLDKIVWQITKKSNIVFTVNENLVPALIIFMIVQVMTSTLPNLSIRRYQLIPVKKRYLAHIYMMFWNGRPEKWLILFILLPFWINNIFPYGMVKALFWLAALVMLLFVSNISALLIKIYFITYPVFSLVLSLVAAAGITYEFAMPFLQLHRHLGIIFESVLMGNYYAIVIMMFLVIIAYACYIALFKKAYYIDHVSTKKGINTKTISLFETITLKRYLLKNEFIMQGRDRKSRQTFISGLLFAISGMFVLIFFGENAAIKHPILAGLLCYFVTGFYLVAGLGAYFFVTDGPYLPAILSRPIRAIDLLKSKLFLLRFIMTVCLIINLLLFYFYPWFIRLLILSFYLYCNGILLPLILLKVLYSRVILLPKDTILSTKPLHQSWIHVMVLLAATIIPFLILFAVTENGQLTYDHNLLLACGLIGSAGLVSFLLTPAILRAQSGIFRNRKYKLLERIWTT